MEPDALEQYGRLIAIMRRLRGPGGLLYAARATVPAPSRSSPMCVRLLVALAVLGAVAVAFLPVYKPARNGQN